MRRIPVVIAIGSALCLAAQVAHAVSFGRVDNATVLGQPLDFSAVVSAAAADEPIDNECLSADVFAGDNKLPAPLVRVRLEPGADGRQASVRVTTTVRIDEPLVTVSLMIGCPVKLSRKFVAFVDPPVIALPRVAGEPANDAAVANDTRRDAPPTTTAALAPSPSVARAPVANRPPRRPAPPKAVAAVTPRPGPARSAGTPASAAATVVAAGTDRAASAPGRLVLDSAAPAASVAPISAAASAILAAELESYAKELAIERQRMKALEDSVERMRRENETTRASLARVQAQLHEAGGGRGLPYWVWALFAALGAVIVGLLWWQSTLRRRAAWWADSKEPLSSADADPALPDVTPAFVTPAGSAVDEETTVAVVSPLAAGPLPMRDAPPPVAPRVPAAAGSPATPRSAPGNFDTQPMPPGSFPRPVERDFDDQGKPARELSVEELIDMEQQAEFFVVLGQDDAAIDLLMGLVRSSGGLSPMPYLKLLEIYRRLGERDAYDRIRERFNQRFNGVAPTIELDPAMGLDLTGYPDVLGRIQAAWGQAQQVLTIVERLLPRTPGDDATLFDLQAFDELLFLARIARDLSDIDTGLQGVDFLLPLDVDPLVTGPATMSLHAPYEPHKAMMDLTLDLDLAPMELDPPSR